MTDITPFVTDDINIIKSYGENHIRIHDKIYSHSIIVSATHIAPWDIDDFASLGGDDLQKSFLQSFTDSENVELLIIGSGKKMRLLPASLKNRLLLDNIPVDFMSTPAAIRTYNIALSESRQVIGAFCLL